MRLMGYIAHVPRRSVITVLWFVALTHAFAQAGGIYDISWSTIDSGGGTSSGGSYGPVSLMQLILLVVRTNSSVVSGRAGRFASLSSRTLQDSLRYGLKLDLDWQLTCTRIILSTYTI
jgi:hypothetical protein